MIRRNVSMVSADHRKCLRTDYAMLRRVCDSIIKCSGNLCYWSSNTRDLNKYSKTQALAAIFVMNSNEHFRSWSSKANNFRIFVAESRPNSNRTSNSPNRNSKFWMPFPNNYFASPNIPTARTGREEDFATKINKTMNIVCRRLHNWGHKSIFRLTFGSRWFMLSSLLCLHCMSPGS